MEEKMNLYDAMKFYLVVNGSDENPAKFILNYEDVNRIVKSIDTLRDHVNLMADRCVFLEQANQGLQEEKENLQDIIHNIQDYCKLRIIECVDIAYLVSNNWIMCCFDKHSLNDIHSLEELKEVLKYE